MKNLPESIKLKLDTSIQNVVDVSRLYVKNPEKDFTRKRSLPLTTVIEILLAMGGNNLNKELLSFFMHCVLFAESTVFFHFYSIWIVFLVLCCVVISLLAFLTC